MNIIQKIRIYIGNKFYKRNVSKIKRTVKAAGLQQVKTVGIILEDKNVKYVREIKKHLPVDVIITVIAYIDGKKSDYSYISDKVYNYISIEDFDFFMRPKNESIKQFIDNKFDILFVLSFDYHFAIDLISGLSLSQFKIGQSGVYEKNLDLYMEINKRDLDYLISQIVHYMG